MSQDRRTQGNGRNSQHNDRDLASENTQLRRENNILKGESDPSYMYTRRNTRCYNCRKKGHLARECRYQYGVHQDHPPGNYVGRGEDN